MTDCLVTGGAGFIGSHLMSTLDREGMGIRAIDNERSGDWSRVVAPCERIHRDLAAMTVDEFAEACDGVDVVFHLAAEKYNSSKSTPERVIATNISATQRLLDAAVRVGVRKVVFTSSLYAYGSLGPAPMCETDLPKPITTYGMSKVAGEHMLRTAGFQSGLAWAVARLFFVYGTHQYAEGGYKSVIISNFERLLRGEAPVIFGDGTQALDYVYIDDVTRALLMLADPANDGVLVNVGSGEAVDIRTLTGLMCEVADSASSPRFEPPDWTAGSVRAASIARILDLVGWRPEVSLPAGLEHVWNWMRSQDG